MFLLALVLPAAGWSQSSSFRRSQWQSVADQPVALDIARGEQRSGGHSFLLVRGTSSKALAIDELAVKVSASDSLRNAARNLPAYGCSELQRTAKPPARESSKRDADPGAGDDVAKGVPDATEQIVWRCELGQELMSGMLDGSISRLEFQLAASDGLQQAVTVELGWLRRRRLANLR